jgi:hypothetical protein
MDHDKALELAQKPEVLDAFKAAIQAMEASWDAQRALELAVGEDFDTLDEALQPYAVANGGENVTQDDLIEFLETISPRDDKPPIRAVCPRCQQVMLDADGCKKIRIAITNKSGRTIAMLAPIRYGEETRYNAVLNYKKPIEGQRCHDCGALPGHFHHRGCDWEECPGCHHQFLMCEGSCGQIPNLKDYKFNKDFDPEKCPDCGHRSHRGVSCFESIYAKKS